MSDRPISGKEPWLAVILSTFFPGIGQIYAGNRLKGIIFIVAHISLFFLGVFLLISSKGNIWIGLIFLLTGGVLIPFWNLSLFFLGVFLLISSKGNIWIGLIFLLTGGVLIPFWNLFDAHSSARKANNQNFERLRKSNKDPWLAVFLSKIIPGLGHLYIGKLPLGFFLVALAIFPYVSLILPQNLFISISSIFLSLFMIIALPFVAYDAYIASPLRRETSKKLIIKISILIFIIPIVLPIGLAFFIRGFLAEARYIPSGNMMPTLQVNDRLIIDKLSYRFEKPQRRDIVVFTPTDTLKAQNFKVAFMKRIIGLPGEKVEVKEGKVYINDRPLQENYIAQAPNYRYGPVIVPTNSYFVLGDNRNNSYDSHYWGFVPRELLIGKATKRFWPPKRMGVLK